MLSLFSPRSFTEIFPPRSFPDMVSPKTEDRVLDCALLFNKLRGGQNMVILSNSVALKIKAMSEVPMSLRSSLNLCTPVKDISNWTD
jgi:hypothetical protein